MRNYIKSMDDNKITISTWKTEQTKVQKVHINIVSAQAREMVHFTEFRT